MVLLRGKRAQAALIAANEALERGEIISARLNDSLSALRSRRDELRQKVENDLARSALNHLGADLQTAVVVLPEPLVRWSYS